MQFFGQGKPPVGIILETSMGRSIDEVLALALAYGLDGKNEARLICVSVSTPNLKAAAFCEAVGRFYAGATNPEFRGFFRSLPIGLAIDPARPVDDPPMLTAALAKAAYSHDIRTVNDTAEPAPLIRNALTSQYDQNAIVVLTGPATSLVKVLDLPGCKELIASKVCLLSVVTSEFNLKSDTPAAKKLFAEWPSPIVAVDSAIGDALPFPASSIEKDFAWSTAHPIVDAYRAFKPMPYDAPTANLAAVLYAVRPKEGYFQLSGAGVLTVSDDGRTKFTPAPEGKHQQLILDPAQKERVIKTYTEIASAKPVPKQPRFRPEQKKPEKKPDEKPDQKQDAAPKPQVPPQ